MAGRPLPQELTAALGAIISERAGRRVSNREIAEKLGVHPSQVGRYLSGTKSPTIEEIRIMAEAVGADWFDLLQEAHARVASGESDPGSMSQGIRQSGIDPRTLIQTLMDNPDQDQELQTRLSEAGIHPGTRGSRMKHLAATIRELRSEELRQALQALPPSPPTARGHESGAAN